MTVRKQLQVAGWREWLGLPGLGIKRIKAKLDTGARTSALSAVRLERFDHEGAEWVRFTVHARQRSTNNPHTVESPVHEWRVITSSSGDRQKRPVIITDIEWFGQSWPIELTLTNRDSMGFRMLLGREALRGRISVDPGRSYFNGKPKRRRKAKAKRTEPSP